jgi:hypothetical protein
MANTMADGAKYSTAAQLLKQLKRLEHTNTMLAEEARLAKDALRSALDKLGFDWSPASRDYTILCEVLAVASLPEVERSLQHSEERRVKALQTIVQLRHAVSDVMKERNDVLLALVRHCSGSCYRCTYTGHSAVVIETDMGNACWFVETNAFSAFEFLTERPAPIKILAKHERSLALAVMN